MSGGHGVALEDARGSIIGRLAPRTRLLAAVVFVLATAALRNPGWMILAVLAGFGLAGLAAIPLPALMRRLLHLEGFLLVVLVSLPFTISGDPIWTVGPLTASHEGLMRAVGIVLRVTACVLAVTALVGTMEPVRLGRAMAGLGIPPRLVHLFLFSVRYIGVFGAELGRLREAMRARAFVPRSNRHSWRTAGNLAGMLLVRALDRAERVDEAMRARAFSGRLPLLASEAPVRRDLVFAGLVAGFALALVVGDHLR